MTDPSVRTNAPVDINSPPGSTINDPSSIADALKRLEESNLSQPMRFAGSIEATSEAAGVTEEELRAVTGERPEIKPLPAELPQPTSSGAPAWAIVPADLTFPRGRVVYFLRFEPQWTDNPKAGIRQCIFWSMSVGDKKLALQRSMGDAQRAADEMIKSCIRSFDGKKVDLSNAELDVWWNEIGEKCRGLLQRVFAQATFLKPQELQHFLANCIEARSSG